ncbi:MAG: tetratricopeptide repeat protein [Promethearchaeota archaeon]
MLRLVAYKEKKFISMLELLVLISRCNSQENPMKKLDISFTELLEQSGKLTFLVGAGCSADPPSNLPLGREMIEAIVRYSCAESEVEEILSIDGLRFEQVVEIVRENFDKGLKIIDYYEQCVSSNQQHFFLVEMLKKGHFVMTTNFDFLIECALMESGVPQDEIVPVITRKNYENRKYQNPTSLFKNGKKGIYKIHGSTKNIVTGEDTRESLVTTMQAFGRGKEGESVFQLEPFKRPALNFLSDGRSLVVMGYSGSDDFDVVPTLKALKNLNKVLWINHTKEDDGIEKIYEIESKDFQKAKIPNKVLQILVEIHDAHNTRGVYRVDANTNRLIRGSNQVFQNVSLEQFALSPVMWFEKEINPPNEYQKYHIPHMIYTSLNASDKAMSCCNKILELAENKKSEPWKAMAFNNIGSVLQERGDLDGALKHFRKALVIAERLDDLRAKAVMIANIGSLLYDRGELNEALKFYREGLAIDKKLSNASGKATKLNNIGKVLMQKGKLGEALKHYRKALAICEQLGDLDGKATTLNNIGHTLILKGNLKEAEKHNRNALAINEQLGDISGMAGSFTCIGAIFQLKGELDEALRLFQKALVIHEQLGDLKKKASDLNDISFNYYRRGNVYSALDFLEQALQICIDIGAGNSPEAMEYRIGIKKLKNQLK